AERAHGALCRSRGPQALGPLRLAIGFCRGIRGYCNAEYAVRAFLLLAARPASGCAATGKTKKLLFLPWYSASAVPAYSAPNLFALARAPCRRTHSDLACSPPIR